MSAPRRRRNWNGLRLPAIGLHSAQNAVERAGVAAPVGLLLRQPPPAFRRQSVETRAAVVVGRAPLRRYAALPLETMQGLIEGGVLDTEVAAGSLLDRRRDAITVNRL